MTIFLLVMAVWTAVILVAFCAGCVEAVYFYAVPAHWLDRPESPRHLRPASAPTLAQLRRG